MLKEYLNIQDIIGPLILLQEVEGVTYGELAEIKLSSGEMRRERERGIAILPGSVGRLRLLLGANVVFATGLFVHGFLYNFYLDSLGYSPLEMGRAQAALNRKPLHRQCLERCAGVGTAFA